MDYGKLNDMLMMVTEVKKQEIIQKVIKIFLLLHLFQIICPWCLWVLEEQVSLEWNQIRVCQKSKFKKAVLLQKKDML